MADQNQPNDDSVNPLFNKMDALMARHRSASPQQGDDEIPVLTDLAPNLDAIPTLHDEADDIPSLTDVVPNLAAKIEDLERAWVYDQDDLDISHLDAEIAIKPAPLPITPLPFQTVKAPQEAILPEYFRSETPIIRVEPASPAPAQIVSKPESEFIDLPMLDLDSLNKAPLIPPKTVRTPPVSHNEPSFIATDLVLSFDDLVKPAASTAPAMSAPAVRLNQADVPELDLDRILAPLPDVENQPAFSAPADAEAEHSDVIDLDIPTLSDAVQNHTPDATTDHELHAFDFAAQSSSDADSTALADEIIELIELNDEVINVAAPHTQADWATEDEAPAQEQAALHDEVSVQLEPETVVEPELDVAPGDDANLKAVTILAEAAVLSSPDDIRAAPTATLQWDDEDEQLLVYALDQAEAEINLDPEGNSPSLNLAPKAEEPAVEDPAFTTTQFEPTHAADAPLETQLNEVLPLAAIEPEVIAETEHEAEREAEILPASIAPEALTEKALPAIPNRLSSSAVSEITASVGAQLAIDIASEVEQLTRQHFSTLMAQLYGDTLRKLTEEISRDLEAHLAPRIVELVEAELRSKKLID